MDLERRLTPRGERIALAALVIASLVVRAWIAWRGQWSTDPDRGIVHLMAFDMADGLAWPVFYYGQAYMGSLEPMISALFCYLFGSSIYAVALGTAIPAGLLVLPVFFLARRAAGPLAGLFAALFLVVGPEVFCAYMSSPRGGYAISLLVIATSLALAARLADDAWRRVPPARPVWFSLGVVAGLGWWTNPIVAPALGAAALLLLVALRGRFWVAPVWIAAAGFLLGAAPWLVWNASNDWASMSMTSAVGGSDPLKALRLLAHRTWNGLGWPERSPSNDLPQVLLPLLAIAGAAIAWLSAKRAGRTGSRWALAGTALFTLAFLASYATSSFSRTETLRYVLPLVPVAAIVAGLLGAAIARVHPSLALLAALAIAGPHAWSQLRAAASEDPRRAVVNAVPEFAAQLEGLGIDVVFAEYRQTWMNAHTRGRVQIVEPGPNRIPQSDRAGLLAKNPALWPSPSVAAFLDTTRSPHDRIRTPMGPLLVSPRPDTNAWRAIPSNAFAAVTSPSGEDLAETIDGDLATKWRGDSKPGREPPTLLLRLTSARTVVGLFLFSRDDTPPLRVVVEARPDGTSTWSRISGNEVLSGWFWSGPQAYHGELYSRCELRFAPTLASELRITVPPSPSGRPYRFRLSELVALEDAGEPPAGQTPSPDATLAFIETNRIERLYANRWLSDRIATRASTAVLVDSSERLRRRVNQSMFDDERTFVSIDARPGTAILCPVGAAEEDSRRLEALGIGIRREPLDGETALIITNIASAPERLAWVGDFVFADRIKDDPADTSP